MHTFCCWQKTQESFYPPSALALVFFAWGQYRRNQCRQCWRSSERTGRPNSAHWIERLAEGAIGQALGFDLEGYLADARTRW